MVQADDQASQTVPGVAGADQASQAVPGVAGADQVRQGVPGLAAADGVPAGGIRAVRSGARLGLEVPRFFTREGVHPYDELTWELRDAVIKNWRDGSVSFEQRDVEFPATWSMNATTIVAQKYFRGPLGTPQRERSVKQMIDRVADTITAWGVKDGYFTDTQSAEIFNLELKHLLVNQKMAFNSPVWFNVGVEDTPQCSACQPWHALVCTPDGYVPIGEIVDNNLVGLDVYDSRGTTRVTAVRDNGIKRVHRVNLRNGNFIEATGDHLVWVAAPGAVGTWRRVDQLTAGMRLALHAHRPSLGRGHIDDLAVSQAALVGWLHAAGAVEQGGDGARSSPTIEFPISDAEEYGWIKRHLDVVFPDLSREARADDRSPGCRRIVLSGERLNPFIERYRLRVQQEDVRVPALWTAPSEVLQAYLRSVFQAAGQVAGAGRPGVQLVSPGGGERDSVASHGEAWTEDVQLLLLRLGIYSRRFHERDHAGSQRWKLEITYLSELQRFAQRVGFIGWDRRELLASSLEAGGEACPDTCLEEIVEILDLGERQVYDIQTESGEYLSNSVVVHNCFILAVEDTMSSILNWYVEEGNIFKGGSGAGINLSTIRSSKETLSSGGQPSGPVSFMRGADASAGTISSGGKTRRAAKMVVLNANHPDIEDFIWCKAREERKARALRDAGFDMDINGADAYSIQYQNANNSVRLDDAFMAAYENDDEYELITVTTGEVIERKRARDLLRQIAQAAWECADPGLQYDTTINAWHTCPESGRINASNPCSEYVHLDNSACNLASLNLKRFYDYEADRFDIEAYKRAIEITITAQEIIVGNGSYPTTTITETAHAFRQLGLGYANLGALLMSLGLPYDSHEARAWCSTLTGLLTGHAYRTSAEIAKVAGPFSGYPRNATAMLNVIRMHREACETIDPRPVPDDLLAAAKTAWEQAEEIGSQSGFRNSQATVLAPTGTISFLLDCDTTGIEPDLGLVKTKKLVGGGTMSIVNQTVPQALRRLRYNEEQIEAIVAHIDAHKTLRGAPAIREEHKQVFQCAMGDDPIHYMGHVKMIAAAQPFLSGSVSKTVNCPEATTVEEVEQLLYDAWKMGLKAIAIYRDNCKAAQPLSISKANQAGAPAAFGSTGPLAVTGRMVRRRLPKQRPSQTISFRVADAEGYLTCGEYPGDGIGEIFVKLGKQGSTLSGVMDAFAISVSLGLQYGVPLEAYVQKFMNMRFEPAGLTDDEEIRFAASIVDYIARKLAMEYLPLDKRRELGIHTLEERTAAVDASGSLPARAEPGFTEQSRAATAYGASSMPADADAPLCYVCGIKMKRAGSCHVCEQCGATNGCS